MRLRKGLTLIELVVVLFIVAALSALAIPVLSGTIQNANEVSTRCTLNEVRDAVAAYWRDTKHLSLDGVTTTATEAERFNLDWLFADPVSGASISAFSPNTRIGWNGPYLNMVHSTLLIDAWNQSIAVQDVDPASTPRDIRLVSAGPNGTIEIPASTATDALTASDLGDDSYVALSLR